MNTDNFLIEDRDLELARDICKIIENTDTRNRAVANAVAANIASKFFDTELYKVDTITGLHNIGIVLEDIDISDIYINNSYIDVRLFFDDKNLNVPKEHFDNNRLPVAYMFIKISSDLSGAEVVGFALPESIDKSNQHDNSYIIDENSLISFYDIESRLINVEDLYNVEEKEIFAYLDNKLDDKNSFYSKLIASADGRTKLAKAAKAKYIFQFISTPQEENLGHDEKEADSFEFNIDLPSENVNHLDLIEDTDDLSEALVDNSEDELSFENILDEPDVSNEQDKELEILNNDENVSNANEETEEDTTLENSFDFSTTATPSIETIEDTYEELLHEGEDGEEEQEQETSQPEVSEQKIEDNSEQIETLFNNEEEESNDENIISAQKNRNGGPLKLLTVIALLAIIGGAGYFGYSKFMAKSSVEDDTQTNIISDNAPADLNNKNNEVAAEQEAMPIETVNTTEPKAAENEGNAVSIPMIEQNLDASILVSNLKVDWEVPAGYASNTSAKRYLVKLGKIIQLNLKTELLLLNKPPLTNKIAVEIKYNNDSKKFETVGITTSSGEETVDQLIKQTVDKALAMNLNMNTNSFNKLQGNPVLVIRL